MRHARAAWLVAIAAVLVWSAGARGVAAQTAANPDPARFAAEIKAFEDFDRKNTVPKDAVLFVGSSSIRLWPTAERFPTLTVLNRGFGGSHISDVNHYFDQTVGRYAARVIVFYAGDNDVGSGKSIDQALSDYQAFVEKAHGAKADAEIFFIAVKPSLARWTLWPTMKAFNEKVRTFSASRPRLHFVDVASPMLGADGRPRPELFVADGLHMTPAGYDVWTGLVSREIAPFVRR